MTTVTYERHVAELARRAYVDDEAGRWSHRRSWFLLVAISLAFWAATGFGVLQLLD